MTAYDHLPYPDFVHSKTDPNNLAAIAKVMGLPARDPRDCRVLEIACGTGANLVAMASLYPDSKFVGFDLSATQVHRGLAMAQQLNLSNVTLTCDSIETFPVTDEGFDYVLAHGIYSWIPETVADRLLGLCRDALSEGGLALVSYNAYPGWHAKMMIRELLHRQTNPNASPSQRFEQGKRFLRGLIESAPAETAYGKTLREELHGLEQSDPRYVVHEQFEEFNRPCYLKDFLDAASRHGMKYVGEANLNNLHRSNLTPAKIDELQQLSLIEREQQIDYLRRRTFRQSILCREDLRRQDWGCEETGREKMGLAGSTSWGIPDADSIGHVHLSCNAVCDRLPTTMDSLIEVARTHAEIAFKTTDGIVATVRSKHTMVALLWLQQAWPGSMDFEDLCRRINDLGKQTESNPLPPLDETSTAGLQRELMELAIAGMVELQAVARKLMSEVSEKPIASPTARLFARQGPNVPNQKHQSILLDEPTRVLIEHADGEHTHDALKDVLVKWFSDGRIVLQQNAVAVTDPKMIEQFIAAQLPGILNSLAAKAFFIG